jgi:hypothetical protein
LCDAAIDSCGDGSWSASDDSDNFWLDVPSYTTNSGFFLNLFNLIPLSPLDGGRILRALLSTRMPQLRATRFSASVGRVLALTGAGFALMHGDPMLLLVSVFVFMGASADEAATTMRLGLTGLRARQAMGAAQRTASVCLAALAGSARAEATPAPVGSVAAAVQASVAEAQAAAKEVVVELAGAATFARGRGALGLIARALPVLANVSLLRIAVRGGGGIVEAGLLNGAAAPPGGAGGAGAILGLVLEDLQLGAPLQGWSCANVSGTWRNVSPAPVCAGVVPA